jgi:hypothetical protein
LLGEAFHSVLAESPTLLGSHLGALFLHMMGFVRPAVPREIVRVIPGPVEARVPLTMHTLQRGSP